MKNNPENSIAKKFNKESSPSAKYEPSPNNSQRQTPQFNYKSQGEPASKVGMAKTQREMDELRSKGQPTPELKPNSSPGSSFSNAHDANREKEVAKKQQKLNMFKERLDKNKDLAKKDFSKVNKERLKDKFDRAARDKKLDPNLKR